jgi:hypothetical protein
MQKPLIIGIVGAGILAVAIGLFAFRSGDVGEIRDLSKKGSDVASMVAVIEKSSQPYKLSADEIIDLKKDGVPDEVIVKMLKHKR